MHTCKFCGAPLREKPPGPCGDVESEYDPTFINQQLREDVNHRTALVWANLRNIDELAGSEKASARALVRLHVKHAARHLGHIHDLMGITTPEPTNPEEIDA